MPKILEQPRWSFWKFQEVYEVEVTGDVLQVRAYAAEFFRKTPALDFSHEQDGFRFQRSSGWRGLFSVSERKLRHEVSVAVQQNLAQVRLTITYRVTYPAPLPNVHFRPSDFFKEVASLERWLNRRLGDRSPQLEPLAVQQPGRPWLILFNPVLWLMYRAYRFFSWSTYWTKRRYTAAGQAMLGGVMVAMISGLDVENAVGYQAFTLLLSLLLIAMVFSLRFHAVFSVERVLPRVATAEQPFTYRVLVRNLSPRPQAGITLIEDLSDPRPAFREWRDYKLDENQHSRPFRFQQGRVRSPFKQVTVKEADLPPLPPQQSAETVVEMTPWRRGVVRLEGVTLARPDPFGLYRALKKSSLPQTILVLPKRYPLPPIALPGSLKYQQGGVAMASNIGQSDEFVSLREYRRGDPPRHIHWRSWAKVGKPIVKEFEDEFFVRHALVLDTFTARPQSELFEEAVSVAASFACTVLTQESLLDLLFVGAEAYCFTAGRGLAHADQMLEILGSVQPCYQQPFATLERAVLEHANVVSGCVCVLLDWDELRQRFVEKLRMLGLPVLVLVVRPPGDSQPLDPGPMADSPESLHSLEVGRIEQQLAMLS
ncbi:MAG TPA: DUF58 domain-containing protein [Verrucomicrobiae bacterium]|nr:DUF58 domain-containing protein [Verrucomicrobiae bacterium]